MPLASYIVTRRTSDSLLNRPGWMRIFLVSLLFSFGQLAAQDEPVVSPPTGPDSKASTAAPTETDSAIEPLALRQKKRQSVVLATMLLAGVVTLLLLLLLWILWWSRRTRKLLRAPLPAAGRGDELWYLKAKQDVQKATERLSAIEKETPPPRPRPKTEQ